MEVFFTTRRLLRTTGSSVKPSMSGVILSGNVSYIPGVPCCIICQTYVGQVCTYCFWLFSVTAAFEVTSCIFILKCFNCSNYCVTLPFMLCHNIGQYSHMEMVKRWIATIKKSFLSDNVTILLSLFTHFDLDLTFWDYSFLSP